MVRTFELAVRYVPTFKLRQKSTLLENAKKKPPKTHVHTTTFKETEVELVAAF